jgi:hypothetical protein
VLGRVAAPAAVLIRPDGYVAWVGAGTHAGLEDALTRWFGPPAQPRLAPAGSDRSELPQAGGETPAPDGGSGAGGS